MIIGGGLAGLTAADACSTQNPTLRITVLSAGGGNSPFVHGFNMPLHPDDSVECFEKDTLESGCGQGDVALVRTLCQNSLTLMPALERLGIRFNTNPDGSYQLLRPLGATFPRVVSVGNDAGGAILSKLRAKLTARGNISWLDLRAMELIKNDEDGVCGALCYSRRDNVWLPILAKAVIVAAGGYSNIYPFTTNARDTAGDAVAMAYDAGAELTDMEFVQFEPSVAVWPKKLAGKSVITTMFYDGAVLRNNRGERFMLRYDDRAERVGKDIMARYIAKELHDGNGTEHGGVYLDATGVGAKKLKEVYHDYYQRYLNINVDISVSPMEIAPAPHTSLGGVFCDPDCRTNLDGLFVCGEALGGLHGANRIGGNAGLETMVFGAIAGNSAAAYATEHRHARNMPQVYEKKDQDNPPTRNIRKMREQMAYETEKAAGAIRCGTAMAAGLHNLQAIYDELDGVTYSYQARRLRNDVLTAYLVVLSAYERKESIGCHYRSDSAEEEGKYRIVITKGNRQTPEIRREKL